MHLPDTSCLIWIAALLSPSIAAAVAGTSMRFTRAVQEAQSYGYHHEAANRHNSCAAGMKALILLYVAILFASKATTLSQ